MHCALLNKTELPLLRIHPVLFRCSWVSVSINAVVHPCRDDITSQEQGGSSDPAATLGVNSSQGFNTRLTHWDLFSNISCRSAPWEADSRERHSGRVGWKGLVLPVASPSSCGQATDSRFPGNPSLQTTSPDMHLCTGRSYITASLSLSPAPDRPTAQNPEHPCPALPPDPQRSAGVGWVGANPSGSPEWSLKSSPTLRCLVTHAWFLFLSPESSIFKRQSSFLVAGTGDKHDSVEVCINCGRDGINTRE